MYIPATYVECTRLKSKIGFRIQMPNLGVYEYQYITSIQILQDSAKYVSTTPHKKHISTSTGLDNKSKPCFMLNV